jgi:hypothetical protein
MKIRYLEKILGGPSFHCAVFDLGLCYKVINVLYLKIQAFYGKESSEVGCVRCHQNKSKKPPGTLRTPSRKRSEITLQLYSVN